jgi:hypothetical protein
MAIPSAPSNLVAQTGNAQNYLTWDNSAGATSYPISRSVDGGVTFTALATPTVNEYLDTTAAIGTAYIYTVASTNASGTSGVTTSSTLIPSVTGIEPLLNLRTQARERADRVNSNFVTTAELNGYINQSYFELYDLLVNSFEDYFLAAHTFITNSAISYTLPNGVITDVDGTTVSRPLYKLLGVDLGLSNGTNGYITLRKFDFISRNQNVYQNLTAQANGLTDIRYRVMGSVIQFTPSPASGQYIRLQYVPRMTRLLKDTDMADGVSGWTEYIVVDAAIKILIKEESDVSALMAVKQGLIDRIQAAAQNRDAGAPDTISNTRRTDYSFDDGNGWR